MIRKLRRVPVSFFWRSGGVIRHAGVTATSAGIVVDFEGTDRGDRDAMAGLVDRAVRSFTSDLKWAFNPDA